MKINFRNGKFNNITGGTNADPFANSMAAIDALASRPPIPDNFTGYIDTENGYAFNTVDLESQHQTATEELMRALAPGLHRYSPHYGPNGPFMAADASGGYVLYADYVKLEQGYMHEVNAHAETKAEHNRVALEGQRWREKAEALHNERRKFRGGLVKALGVATGWGHDYPSDDQLVDRVSEMVIRGDNRAKDNKHHIETINELKNRLHFADDFKAQVLNLIGMEAGTNLDNVYYVIQAMAAKFNATEPGEREPVMTVRQVGEVMQTDMFEHPPETVGKAVFECTFEWAREHWDLLTDSIFYKTINEHGEPTGYIKVVTTS